jgi:subtilase family serine protease
MMAVYDEEGNLVAEINKSNPEAEDLVKVIKKEKPELEIDYGENNVVNAPDMRESYQMGGLIPGLDKGFGQKPKIGQNLGINPMQGMYEEGGEIPKYKKGGKVKK